MEKVKITYKGEVIVEVGKNTTKLNLSKKGIECKFEDCYIDSILLKLDFLESEAERLYHGVKQELRRNPYNFVLINREEKIRKQYKIIKDARRRQLIYLSNEKYLD